MPKKRARAKPKPKWKVETWHRKPPHRHQTFKVFVKRDSKGRITKSEPLKRR